MPIFPEFFREETASFDINITGIDEVFIRELGVTDITMTESLLSPSLETTISIQAPIHEGDGKSFKDWSRFRGEIITLNFSNPNILNGLGQPDEKSIRQVIYRMENREVINLNMEKFVIRSCDATVIANQKNRMSKQYDCESPSTVVNDALNCIGADSRKIEASSPKRNYIANNIHPFQIIAEQADVAVTTTKQDPSFIHFMTYENGGTHNFRSLEELSQSQPSWEYTRNEPGFASYLGDPTNIMGYEFPCDFDLLTDILNGIDENGQISTSLATINPFDGSASLVNGDLTACGGMGEALTDEVVSDANIDNECEVQIEKFHMKRKARMSLIQQDKIALRIFVPFNPTIYAGNVIKVIFPVRPAPGQIITNEDFGSGDYLIVKIRHLLKSGAYGITTIDCVTDTVGQGLTRG